jgi:hypothetical protein
MLDQPKKLTFADVRIANVDDTKLTADNPYADALNGFGPYPK